MIIDEELDIKKYNSEEVREEFANLAAQWTQDVLSNNKIIGKT